MRPRVLEIGPGKNPVDRRWDTMDMVNRPNLTYKHDVRQFPFPIASNKYDLVYMSHILEHVPWMYTDNVLSEVYRILRPKGKIEVWVPDLKKLVAGYLNPSLIKNDGWYRFNPGQDPVRWFNGRLFTYGPGPENWHRAAFDEEYLHRCLNKASFTGCHRLAKPRGYDHGWINLGMMGTK